MRGRHARPKFLATTNRAILTSVGVAGLGVAVYAGVNLGTGSAGPAASATQSLSAVPSAGNLGVASTGTAVPTPSASSPTAQPTAPVVPVSVSIPSIKVQTTLQMLNLDAAGALNPPTNQTQAGWYTGSSLPGQAGPSVIAGHIDSVDGPAVFYRLSLLKPGDTVTVTLSDQSTVVYQVTAVASYPKNDFPTMSVYGPVPDPELRLITCGGGFANGHYLNNTVVYATLVSQSA
ncbi:MAG TPA: class F sortase [Actinocrinis sp.]|nr:class F sortase [Actinocrinis sp.]